MRGILKIFALASSTVLAGEAEQKMPVLPDLPNHASGVLCTANDGIDRTNKDFMREKVEAIIETGKIYEDGWVLTSRAYGIYGVAGHNNLEIWGPDGKFAALETQQIRRDTGEVAGYVPTGGYAAPVIDDCVLGDTVAIEENLKGETIIFSGQGTEALLKFARAAEQAVRNVHHDYDYRLTPDAGEGEANSNSFARSFAKALGHDIYPSVNEYADFILGNPGIDVDLLGSEPLPSFYDKIESSTDIIHKPNMYENFLSDLKELHPVTQQERALGNSLSLDVLNVSENDGLLIPSQ
ncbi:MAG: hypothetical protein ACRBCK_01855 [Alphaproteobacteria bacterium]